MEQQILQLTASHDEVTKIVRERFAKKRRFSELDQLLADEVPHFEVDSLVLLSLGDSNGGFMIKNRGHSGPFRVVKRSSTSNYVISGADETPVVVHGYKLFPYTPTLADCQGSGSLAASAVGAAQSRLLHFEANDPALE